MITLFSEDNVDMIIEYVLSLSSQETKTLKLLMGNGVSAYKALEQVIDGRTQKIELYLRKFTNDWKNKILAESKNTCYISDIARPNGVEIHHVTKSFDEVLEEIFRETGIVYREKVKDYNPRELKILGDSVVEKHKSIQGIALLSEVHSLFHKEYGVNNNSMVQIEDLKRRFQRGEFVISY